MYFPLFGAFLMTGTWYQVQRVLSEIRQQAASTDLSSPADPGEACPCPQAVLSLGPNHVCELEQDFVKGRLRPLIHSQLH